MSNLPARIDPNQDKKRSQYTQRQTINQLGRKLLKYFFQGLLLLSPIALTFYLLYLMFEYIDSIVPVGVNIPGLGVLIIISIVTIFGYLSNTLLIKPIIVSFQNILVRLPLVKIIYTSLQDLFSAFVSDQKKFDKPVLVLINRSSGIKRLGFITQEDLSQFDRVDEVAVYMPHSYNFSGNLFIVPQENIVLLEDISASDAMKFIVSGGVSNITTKIVKKEEGEEVVEGE